MKKIPEDDVLYAVVEAVDAIWTLIHGYLPSRPRFYYESIDQAVKMTTPEKTQLIMVDVKSAVADNVLFTNFKDEIWIGPDKISKRYVSFHGSIIEPTVKKNDDYII